MADLSINLLPQELTAAKRQRQKAGIVIQICVVALVLIIVAAGIILSFRFAQSAQLSKIQSQIGAVKQKINSPQNSQREGLVVTLKSRLDSLTQVSNQNYPASYAFAMITKMLPPNIKLNTFSIDKKGKSQLQINSPDSASLSLFLNNIMDPQQNEQKVTKATVETVSLSQTNGFDVGLSVFLVGGAK